MTKDVSVIVSWPLTLCTCMTGGIVRSPVADSTDRLNSRRATTSLKRGGEDRIGHMKLTACSSMRSVTADGQVPWDNLRLDHKSLERWDGRWVEGQRSMCIVK